MGLFGGVKEDGGSAFLWTLYFVKNLKPPAVAVKIAATGRVKDKLFFSGYRDYFSRLVF